MRDFAKFVVALIILWVPFSIAAIIAIPVALWALLAKEWEYAKDILRAMDKTAAALLGWGGRYTVSAECGSRRAGCLLCKIVCVLLNFIDPGHCKGAAEREKLA